MPRYAPTSISLAFCLALGACDDGSAVEDDELVDAGLTPDDDAAAVDPPASDATAVLAGLDGDFIAAAEEFGVPAQLLQAVGWTETRWQMVEGEEEFEGMPAAFGVMGLRGDRLTLAAELAGVEVERVKTDRRTNLRAGAALLAHMADELEIDRDELAAWAPVVARYSGIPEQVLDAQAAYVHRGVFAALRDGVEVQGADGGVVARMAPADTLDLADPIDPQAAPGPDYAGSIWRPSSNYSSRPAGNIGKVGLVIIHTCEGNYAGCWGWQVNPSSDVSAHYTIKEDGSEISQLVKESNKAWHIGATYDCKNNSSVECWRNGYNSNNFTVGIEHAGFAKQASWNSNLIDKSAKLVCDITKAHGVPRDKYHIVAHAKLQPYNRTDPGPNWPWATYLSKINTHCGAKPPPPPPPPPPATSIVIDSNNAKNDAAKAKMSVSANWTSTSSTAGYYGTGYFFAETASVSDGATFQFYLPAAATKTIDAWWTSGTNRSTTAPFFAYNAQGTKLGLVEVNQQTNGGKWVQLGSFKFSAGWNKVVLSRWTGAGKVVIADAVRVR